MSCETLYFTHIIYSSGMLLSPALVGVVGANQQVERAQDVFPYAAKFLWTELCEPEPRKKRKIALISTATNLGWRLGVYVLEVARKKRYQSVFVDNVCAMSRRLLGCPRAIG